MAWLSTQSMTIKKNHWQRFSAIKCWSMKLKNENLWNFKIPVAERGRNIVQKLWEEIVSALNDMLVKYNSIFRKCFWNSNKLAIFFISNVKDVKEVKKIWKKVRYNYSQIVTQKNDAKKSGSAASNIKKNKWPYYEKMASTRDLFVDNQK